MPENDLPPIAYDELLERLSDPDSDLDHYVKYMVEVPIPGRMGPDMQPNPALVTGIPPTVEGGVVVSLANGFMRRRRHRAYRRRIRSGWSGPRFVSEGDSWFQYPTSLQDTIDHLMKDNAILSLGAAGDELKDIRRQREIILNIDAEGAKALLLSAGGNDLFDNGQLGRLIEDPFPGASGAELVGQTFDDFLQSLLRQYVDLLRRVHRAFPKLHILVHGYGPAFPRGGSWIEKPLTKRGVPKETQHEVVIEILKRFNAALTRISNRPEFHGKLAHVDVTDIGTDPGDWYDEIHLDGPNYKKVADRFQAELDRRMAMADVESGLLAAPGPEQTQARQFAALDQATLLREIDLRVRLAELDPSAADDSEVPLLFPNQPEPEIGIATLRRATRKLIDRWLDDLREVVCGGAEPDNLLEKAIVEALDKGKETLAAAVSAWLVTGPFGVPAAIAGALAAWLAGEALELGKTALCETWKTKSPPVASPDIESAVKTTIGDLREGMRRPEG
ncbi:MAG: SGNH/GDSL hydrolase family protein, partial [Pseudomonadota bacterium]